VRCTSSCAARYIAVGPAITHAEGHIAFASADRWPPAAWPLRRWRRGPPHGCSAASGCGHLPAGQNAAPQVDDGGEVAGSDDDALLRCGAWRAGAGTLLHVLAMVNSATAEPGHGPPGDPGRRQRRDHDDGGRDADRPLTPWPLRGSGLSAGHGAQEALSRWPEPGPAHAC
jgi:hypothetical protein